MDHHSDFDTQRPAASKQKVVLRRALEGKQHVRRRLIDIHHYLCGAQASSFLEQLLV